MAGYVDSNQTIIPTAKGESSISGGTAFNIGGINLGTQYPSAATAGGGNLPTSSLAGVAHDLQPVLIIGGIAVLALVAVMLWRR